MKNDLLATIDLDGIVSVAKAAGDAIMQIYEKILPSNTKMTNRR